MTVFTQADFLAGKCKHIEVGTEAEPRWATLDATMGACSLEAVGTRRDVLSGSTENLNVNEVVQQALNLIGAPQLASIIAGRPDIVAPLVVKLGLASITKEQAPAVDLDDLTDEQIEGMSSVDLKRLVLKHVGITKKSQI